MFNLFGKKNKKESAPAEEISADELQFEILRKLHENAVASFDLGKVGLTKDETKEVIRAIDAFDEDVPAGLFSGAGFSASNLANAKMAVQYNTSVDATLYGVISNCVLFRIGSSQGRQKERLESALQKLANYRPENKGVYYL